MNFNIIHRQFKSGKLSYEVEKDYKTVKDTINPTTAVMNTINPTTAVMKIHQNLLIFYRQNYIY